MLNQNLKEELLKLNKTFAVFSKEIIRYNGDKIVLAKSNYDVFTIKLFAKNSALCITTYSDMDFKGALNILSELMVNE